MSTPAGTPKASAGASSRNRSPSKAIELPAQKTKSKPSWRNSQALGRTTSLSSWMSWLSGAWVGYLCPSSHEPLANLWICRRTRSNSTKKTTSLLDSHCPWLTLVSLHSLKISRAWKNSILSLSEKMFRNLEVKVFGKVFAYWENLRESETEVYLSFRF